MSAGEIISLVVSNLLTFAAGYGLHVLQARREDRGRKEAAEEAAANARQARKNQVTAFLNVWADEVKDNRKILVGNVFTGTGDMFDRRKRELIKEITAIESDYGGQKLGRLRKLRDAITSMAPGHVENEEGRQKLLQAVRDFAEFLERTEGARSIP